VLHPGLEHGPEPRRRLRYVAGPVRLCPSGLRFSPVSLVYEEGGGRAMLQPWVEHADEQAPADVLDPGESKAASQPEDQYPRLLQAALGELLLLGLERTDSRSARQWDELRRQGEALGFDRLTAPVARIAALLEQKAMSARWDCAEAGRATLELALLARVAREVPWE